METVVKKKKVTILLLIVFFILSIITLTVWAFDTSSTIQNTQTTNITPTSVTVTWTTSEPNIGRVVVTDKKGFSFDRIPFVGLEKYYDDRDVTTNNDGDYEYDPDKSIERYTHHVTVRNLEPEREYFFKILNGLDNYDIGPVKTLVLSEDIQTPDPGYGAVVNTTPNDGFVIIRHKNKAEKFSVPLAENGSYTIDMHLFPEETNASDLLVTVLSGENLNQEYFYRVPELRPFDTIYVNQEEESALSSSILGSAKAQDTCPNRPDHDSWESCYDACAATFGPGKGCEDGCNYECGAPKPSGDGETPALQQPTTPQPSGTTGDEGYPCNPTGPRCNSGGGSCSCNCSGTMYCGGRTQTCNQVCGRNTPSGAPPTALPSGTQTVTPSISTADCLKLDSRDPNIANKLAGCGWGGCQGFQNGNKEDNKFFCASGGPAGGGCYTTNSVADGECKPWGGGSGTTNVTQQILSNFNGNTTAMCARYNADPAGFVNSYSVLGDSNVVNCNYGGNNCSGGWADTSWYSSAPDDVPNSDAANWNNQVRNCNVQYQAATVIGLGTNDCTKGVPVAQFEANLREIVNTAVSNGSNPILQLIPRNDMPGCTNEEAYNASIQRVAAQFDAQVVNTPAYVEVGNDGVHYNDCSALRGQIQATIQQVQDLVRTTCGSSVSAPYQVPYSGGSAKKNHLFNTLFNSSKAQNTKTQLTVNDPGLYSVNAPEGSIAKLNIVTNGNTAVIKVFNDENQNNIKDVNEEFIEDLSGFELNKEASTLSYTLNAGWNLIHIPMVEDGNSEFNRASELIDSFNRQSAEVIHVAKYDGNFEIFTKRENDTTFANDYEIIPGQAVFVYNNTTLSKVSLTGREFAQSVPIKVKNGWNLVGFISPDKEYNSEGILVEAHNQEITATVISKYEGGLYDSVVREEDTLFGNNFSILPTQGYFLKVIDARKDEFNP